jgi:hypothetical protein
MRHLLTVAVMALGGLGAIGAPASAQTSPGSFTTTNRPPSVGVTPAPVSPLSPSSPATRESGAPSLAQIQVAPPSGDTGVVSPAGATPFSGVPSGTGLPDGQPPSAHDETPDGLAGPTQGPAR